MLSALQKREAYKTQFRSYAIFRVKRLHCRSRGLTLDNIHVPFQNVIEARTGSRKRNLQIPRDLCGLRADVCLVDNRSRAIDAILAADVDCPARDR